MLELINIKLRKKTFNKIKMIFSLTIGAIIAFSVVQGYWFLPAIIVPIFLAATVLLKNKIKGVLADERDYKIGGDAARMTYFIFALSGATIGAMLIATKIQTLTIIGYTLAYSACALLLMYMAFFWYYNRRE